MDYGQILTYLTDGVADTMLLFILVFIDTVLGFAQAVKNNKKIVSRTLLSGIIANLLLCVVPSAIAAIGMVRPSVNKDLFSILSVGYSVLLACGVIQSILANLHLLGVKLPSKLINWLTDELIDKENKNKKDDESKDNGDNNDNKKDKQ